MNAPSFSMIALSLFIIVICLFDMMLELFLGNQYTFSWNLLGIETRHPLFGLGMCVSLMTLIGHLCLPHLGPSLTGLVAYVRVAVGLSPVLATLIVIAFHPQSAAIAAAAEAFAGSNLRHGLLLWLSAGYGLLNGAFAVPQHP